MSRHLDGDQRHQKYAIDPRRPIQQPVIVDLGKDEHAHHAGANEHDLLGFKARKPGVNGCRVDFQHGDYAQDQHQSKQGPVEVAKAQETAHQCKSSLKRSSDALSQAGSAGAPVATAVGPGASGPGSTKKCPALTAAGWVAVPLRPAGSEPGETGSDQTAPTSTGFAAPA